MSQTVELRKREISSAWEMCLDGHIHDLDHAVAQQEYWWQAFAGISSVVPIYPYPEPDKQKAWEMFIHWEQEHKRRREILKDWVRANPFEK
jgi:hypothetical protein